MHVAYNMKICPNFPKITAVPIKPYATHFGNDDYPSHSVTPES